MPAILGPAPRQAEVELEGCWPQEKETRNHEATDKQARTDCTDYDQRFLNGHARTLLSITGTCFSPTYALKRLKVPELYARAYSEKFMQQSA